MMTKPRISPKVFDAIKTDYEDAARQRRLEIRRLYQEEGWKQQEIADYFKIDISRVNKIINQADE
jgi:DNA-binding transcriptional regulator LsrR (DeoR family)